MPEYLPLQYITLSHKSSNRKNYLDIHWLEGKMLFLMWQITILMIFITFEVHMTEASCDETQLSFSQNYDKGISPSGKILCLKNVGLLIIDISVVQIFLGICR